MDIPFFFFERTATEGDKSVKLKMRYVEKKTRISVEEYPAFRDAVSEVLDSLGQDLILKPKR